MRAWCKVTTTVIQDEFQAIKDFHLCHPYVFTVWEPMSHLNHYPLFLSDLQVSRLRNNNHCFYQKHVIFWLGLPSKSLEKYLSEVLMKCYQLLLFHLLTWEWFCHFGFTEATNSSKITFACRMWSATGNNYWKDMLNSCNGNPNKTWVSKRLSLRLMPWKLQYRHSDGMWIFIDSYLQ